MEKRNKCDLRKEFLDKRIIFTVPHGCSPFMLVCDENADRIARETANILGIDDVFISRYPRNIKDMNRGESRDKDFRKMIKEKVHEKNLIHLDVHSFSENYEDWKGFDTIVFDIPLERDNILSPILVEEFNKVGLKTKKINASIVNDLVRVSQEAGTPAVLIEFRDTLDVHDTAQKFAKVIQNISRCV